MLADEATAAESACTVYMHSLPLFEQKLRRIDKLNICLFNCFKRAFDWVNKELLQYRLLMC